MGVRFWHLFRYPKKLSAPAGDEWRGFGGLSYIYFLVLSKRAFIFPFLCRFGAKRGSIWLCAGMRTLLRPLFEKSNALEENYFLFGASWRFRRFEVSFQ